MFHVEHRWFISWRAVDVPRGTSGIHCLVPPGVLQAEALGSSPDAPGRSRWGISGLFHGWLWMFHVEHLVFIAWYRPGLLHVAPLGSIPGALGRSRWGSEVSYH